MVVGEEMLVQKLLFNQSQEKFHPPYECITWPAVDESFWVLLHVKRSRIDLAIKVSL